MLFSGGFTFPNFLADVLSIFIFVLWFWLLITVFSDLFRRRDISGRAKTIWVIALIILPYLGIFIYLIRSTVGWRNVSSSECSRLATSFGKWSDTARRMRSRNSNG